MSLPFADFECDKCGACCRGLIIEADWCDAQREPRLYEIDPSRPVNRGKLRDGERIILLYDEKKHTCSFLDGETNVCGIYATRPNVCVMVEAGDAKCQQARQAVGLPLLRDRHGNEPSRDALADSCEDYGLDVEEILQVSTEGK